MGSVITVHSLEHHTVGAALKTTGRVICHPGRYVRDQVDMARDEWIEEGQVVVVLSLHDGGDDSVVELLTAGGQIVWAFEGIFVHRTTPVS